MEIVLSVSAGFIQLYVFMEYELLWSLRSISLVLIDVLDLVSEPMSESSSSEDEKLDASRADIETLFVLDEPSVLIFENLERSLHVSLCHLKKRHHRSHSDCQYHRRHSNLASRTSRVRRGAVRITKGAHDLGIVRPISPVRPSLRRRTVRRRKSAADLQIRQDHVQRAQLLAKSRRAVPLATAPVVTARQAVFPARALRRGAFGRRPQDEVDLRVEVGGGCSGLRLRGGGDVGDAGDVWGDDGAR